MTFKKIALSIIVGSFAVQPLNAFLTNMSVWRLKIKHGCIQILLESDAHIRCTEDQHQKRLLFNQIQRLKNRETPTTYLVEAPEDISWFNMPVGISDDAYIQHSVKNPNHMLIMSMRTMGILCKNFGAVNFELSDIRSIKLAKLFAFFKEILNIDAAKYSTLRTCSLFSEASTVKELFKEIESASICGLELVRNAQNDEIRATVQQVLDTLNIACSQAKEFFKHSNEQDETTNILYSYFQNDFAHKLDAFLQPCWLGNIASCIGDIGFLKKFLAAIETGKDCVVFSGAAHTGVLFDLLEKLKNKGQAQCLLKTGELLTRNEAESSGFFASPTPLPIAQLERCLKIFENACFACDQSTNQMQKCGACKIAKYCSAECQKKDWPKHKLVCKPQGNTK